jgi:hypothetical protein
MEIKKKDFFWPSYVDLLTALFAIVLVLFVLSFKLFKDRENELIKEKNKFEVYAKEYERIQKINIQVKALENSGSFIYDSLYQRFLVKDFIGQEIFQSKSNIIKPEYYNSALKAGKEIKKLIDELYKNENIKFLILIEGNTANKYDGSIDKDNEYGYNLSYQRALALYRFWKYKGIIFDPNRTEIIIAGSGFSGVGRDKTEENNKRFLIQIIPKLDK